MFPLAGLFVLGVLISQGRLSPHALDGAPPREVGITLMDLLIGVLILLLMTEVFRPVLGLLGIPLPGSDPPPTARHSAYTALLGQTITQLPVALYCCWRALRETLGLRRIGLTPSRPLKELGAGVSAFLAAMPLVLGSSALFLLLSRLFDMDVPKVAHDLLRKLLSSPDQVAVALMVVSAVVLAPLLEEVIFRGLVQTALLSWAGPQHRWSVVLIAAALFALVHGDVATWHVLPGLFILGLILGWLYEKHGSLLPGVVLHALFNLANIGLGMLQSRGGEGG